MASSKTIIRTDSLSTDRINGEFDDDFISCPICTNILWKPIACKTCENAFCLKCIRLWLNDNPNKCPFNCYFQEKRPPPILLKILSKLKLDCRYKMNGCTLSIPYEALEKHELEECDYKLTQCSNCLKEMLKKDLDEHEKECLPQEEICLKCSCTYKRNNGQHTLKCLENQITTLTNSFTKAGKTPSIVMENYNKMMNLYNRLHLNQNYARKTQLVIDPQDFTPSAPVYESLSPPSLELGSLALFTPSINTNAEPTRASLRISKVSFANIPQAKPEGDHIPNGYAGFNWENAYYMFKAFAKNTHQLKFLNAFTDSGDTVVYNGYGRPLSIFLPNPQQTFGLHSFVAMPIYHNSFKLVVTVYRSGVILDTKSFALTNKNPTLFEMDREKIDRITFKPETIMDTLKPETFVLTCLNFVF